MELTIEQVLQQGIAAHKEGKLQEAERLYRTILQSQPLHPDANHNLGGIAVSVNKSEAALPLFKIALEANPKIEQFWLSYIDALIKEKQFDNAKAVLAEGRKAGLSGDYFDALEAQVEKTTQPEMSKSPDDKKSLTLKEKGENFSNNKLQNPSSDQLQHIINLYTQGQVQQALFNTIKMLERFPNSAVLYNIAGISNASLLHFDAAINNYKHALNINPSFAEAYTNIGNALKNKGDPKAAIDNYKQALKINPELAIAHYNIGITLYDNGDLKAAIGSYKQALKINPDLAVAHFELGNCLNNKRDIEAAIESYKRAIKIKPDYAQAHNNMGILLKNKGDFEAALDNYKQALKFNPDYRDAYINIGNILKQVVFTKPDSNMCEFIISILNNFYARPSDISHAAISLLKLEPGYVVSKELSLGRVKQSLEALVFNLSATPLLLKLMCTCPLADLELEATLVDVRAAMLLSIFEVSNSSEVLHFQSALALQCFTNEYVYSQSDNETRAIGSLEISIEQVLLEGEQPPSHLILCLAAYKALSDYKWCDLLTVNTDIEQVFIRQVVEPKQEAHLKFDLPVLQEITNNVSIKVRGQYEASPYPRWVNIQSNQESLPISKIVQEMKLRLFDKTINGVEAPNILIAGCGTGQHSIEAMLRFKNAQVLAVDLSLSSLAYAKRKTEDLGIQNIDYMQADILDLVKLGRKFDIIESVGVLHHMDDPLVAWKVLVDCLKSGGLLKIGLYSELARQQIIGMREEINQSGIGSSNDAIKLFRSDLLKSKKARHKLILSSSDFYSMSTLRDLLFHVKEHRFTIPQLQNSLEKLGLKLCGFEGNDLVQKFKLANTKSEAQYDLDKWNTYEKANPDTFEGMYQFWCQKIN